MQQNFSGKESYLLSNTLNCLPVVLRGHSVLVDLRNETSVAGRIESADGSMNIHLSEAVYIDRSAQQYPFEEFMLRERMIRYIHIPAAIDVEAALRDWFEHGLRRSKPLPKKGKRSYKQKRAEVRHQEILQDIKKQNDQREQESGNSLA